MAPKERPSSSQSRESSNSNTMPLQALISAQKDVAYAVNYSISSVEAFVVPTPRRKHDFSVDSTTPHSTEVVTNRKRPRTEISEVVEKKKKHEHETPSSDRKDNNLLENNSTISAIQPVRKSRRQPKPRREFSNPSQFEKSRVRYDIHLVPEVKKNRDFLLYWREEKGDTVDENETGHRPKHELLKPFIDDETVVWVPSSRGEWEDSLSEMTYVCKSAASRRYVAVPNISTSRKPFYAPLSREYIRDRIDIDDPIIGYQFRHKIGGWLQGFIMFTNFTTWSHYFKWDSMHEASGVQGPQTSSKVDADGSLAIELESQERSGDPLAGGIVFSSIAEISLVGALGCGEYLLRMALDKIRSCEQYQYVVLQATDSSRTFYEKFGFIRVGAISRYGPRTKGRRPSNYSPSLSEIVGYRHWTYAHESERSLGKHGGPSYMMVLRIDRSSALRAESGLFLEKMMKYSVVEKPKVKQLGSFTPLVKKTLPSIISTPSDIQSVAPSPVGAINTDETTPTQTRKRGRPPLSEQAEKKNKSTPVRNTTKHIPKKRRLSSKNNYEFMKQRNELLTPPPSGKSLSYAQKQYQSIWLAVPPKVDITPRRPPRERQQLENIAKRRYSKSRLRKEGVESTRKKNGKIDSAELSQSPSQMVLTSRENAIVKKDKSKGNGKEDSIRTRKSITHNDGKVAKLGVGDNSKNNASMSTRSRSNKYVYSLRSSMEREASDKDEDKSKSSINDAELSLRRSLRSRNDGRTDLHSNIRTTNSLDRSYVTNSRVNGSISRSLRSMDPRRSDTTARPQFEKHPRSKTVKRQCKANCTIEKESNGVKKNTNQSVRKAYRSMETNIESCDTTPANAVKTRRGNKSCETNKSPPINEMKKQKNPASPECYASESNFFNKVVKRKGSLDEKYYFVLNFNTDKMFLKICPLYKQGVFIGKRSGRTRWKLDVKSKILHETARKFEIVPTQMVAKTPFVANETWDILE